MRMLTCEECGIRRAPLLPLRGKDYCPECWERLGGLEHSRKVQEAMEARLKERQLGPKQGRLL